MSDKAQQTVSIVAKVIVFCLSIWLVTTQQREIGYMNLFWMFVGLSGLLILMYLYNRKHK